MSKRKASKKHKGIRDPLKQLAVKHQKIKNKINNPPRNPNDQELSKFARSFLANGTQTKSKKPKRKKSKHSGELTDTSRFISTNVGAYPKEGRAFKPIPTLVQNPNETEYKFFKRVSKATEVVKHESNFQDKYKVEVQRDQQGQVTGYHSRPEYHTKKKFEASIAKVEKKKLKNKERELKKKLIKLKKRKSKSVEDAESSEDENENKEPDDNMKPLKKKLFTRDEIKFGEVVHAPPIIDSTVLAKKVKEDKKLQIKNYLFLQTLKMPIKDAIGVEPSNLRKKVLEIEREKAVFAYKQLKADKNNYHR